MTLELTTNSLQLFPPSFSPWREIGSKRAIAVLMSGGVDSSVTAMLLQESGWNVLGITMKIPAAENCNQKRPCCGAEAAIICNELGIPHYFVDVEEAFRRYVIEPFQHAYMEGRTPNPCIDCNTFLKFGLVWELLEKSFGVTHLATGHYARVVTVAQEARLARAVDQAKDQSYFLYGIPRSRLARFVLPLGDLEKREVRSLARAAKLSVADRDESMELCFAGEDDYRQALAPPGKQAQGPILDTAGNVLAQHNGIFNYTLGQRKHLGVAAGEPRYVVRILPEEQTVIIGTREEASSKQVRAENINVLISEQLGPGNILFGKIRSRGEPESCTVSTIENGTIRVQFETPQFAPCPGQCLVLYNKMGQVVAGGTISL